MLPSSNNTHCQPRSKARPQARRNSNEWATTPLTTSSLRAPKIARTKKVRHLLPRANDSGRRKELILVLRK